MKKRIIHTSQAPDPVGPYSQGVRIGNFLYTAGQIALDPKTGEFLSGKIEEETEHTLRNIEAILKSDGLTMENVVKTTVYLADLSQFSRMNNIYQKFFEKSKPARSCIQVAALPKGAKIEIDAVAFIS